MTITFFTFFHLICKPNTLKISTTHASSFAKFGTTYASQKYIDVFNQFILQGFYLLLQERIPFIWNEVTTRK